MAALTTAQRKDAARWFARTYFEQAVPAAITKGDLDTAILDGDAWVDAAPAGGATNGAAFKTAIDATTFRTPIGDAGQVVNDAIAVLFASIALARAGKL